MGNRLKDRAARLISLNPRNNEAAIADMVANESK